jgi:hypothetical protein
MKKIKILNKIISDSLYDLSHIKCQIRLMKKDSEIYPPQAWEDDSNCPSFVKKCIKEYKASMKDESKTWAYKDPCKPSASKEYTTNEIKKSFEIVEHLTGLTEIRLEEICLNRFYELQVLEHKLSDIMKKISLLQLPSND